MTTEAFNRTNPLVIKALAAVKNEHCRPPSYAPAAPVAAQMQCPRCKSRLNYTVGITGLTSGRCVAAACLKWSLQ